MRFDKVRELFRYEDGRLYNKVSRGNRALAGAVAGSVRDDGYSAVCIDYKMYLIHRMVWLMHNEELPECIDHIDRDTTNNKIENLRECSRSENNWNMDVSSHNTSGVKGVHYVKRTGKWQGHIKVHGKKLHVGTHTTRDLAEEAVIGKRLELHKEFACNG